MANKTQKIRIESILGGESGNANFSTEDQFRSSFGINPLLPIYDVLPISPSYEYDGKPSGYLRPTPSVTLTTGTLSSTASICTIDGSPRGGKLYLNDSSGSLYTFDPLTNQTTALSDGGSLSNSSFGTVAYYDNYVYVTKNTTVARYGPLSGTAGFDGDYFGTTLGLSSLTQGSYPQNSNGLTFPFHILHRHSDGKLYITDVVGGNGSLSRIGTTKTSVEGDTNNGSAFNIVNFGYGFYPTAIESYGDSLVVGLYEGPYEFAKNAKLAFWDTVSQNINSITTVEFPDQFILSIKNINGTLFIISSNSYGYNFTGIQTFRLSRYVGGSSVETIKTFLGEIPAQGSICSSDNKLFFGTFSYQEDRASVIMYVPETNSTFAITGCENGRFISAISPLPNSQNGSKILTAWRDITINNQTGLDSNNTEDASATDYEAVHKKFWSQVSRIGYPFKITKIRLPVVSGETDTSTLLTGTNVEVSVWTDDRVQNTVGTITETAFGTSERAIVLRPPTTITGNYNFWLEIKWNSSNNCVFALPIIIEYEPLDD